ncbi:glycosyltransferase [bacterium]|nr:glycosyltransferase [bacterium]
MIFNAGLAVVLASICLICAVYGIYIWAILWGKGYHSPGKLDVSVPVSIIIPAYNEGKVIWEKIKNLSEIDYPSEMMEVIIIDDCSEDATRKKALSALEQFRIKGKVITNQRRQGTNANYNQGFDLASHDLIITTDADVVFEKDAIRHILNVLVKEKQTGAACGELIPRIDRQSLSTGIEGPYRDVFGKICGWESRLHSTYCFNGPLIAIKREAMGHIPPRKGASDTNIALMAIRKGYHARYVPEARFYEWIALRHDQQQRQKIRRATRLLESTWSARHLILDPRFGKFGSVVLPLRFAMLFAVPVATLGSLLILTLLGFMVHPIYGIGILTAALILFVSARWYNNILSSFIWHQYYLLMGLFQMARPAHLWESIERKTSG